MKVDAITKRILDDAREQAAQTLAEANERADALKRAAEERMARSRASMEGQTAQDCETMRGRMLRMAELEAKKQLLGAKREVIDQAFETALAGLRNMPKEQRVLFNRELLLRSAQGGERIVCDGQDEDLFGEAFLKDVNARLKQDGKPAVLMGEDRRATGGGFILSSGGMEINCSYAAVLAQARLGLEAEVARMLFGGA